MAEPHATPDKNAQRTGHRASSTGPADPPATPAETPAEKALNAKIDGEVAERAMNAFYGTREHARWRDYIQAALDEYTTKLERDKNKGEPFPQRPAENLTRGRKVGISPARTEHQ